jgi:hypothetical protein
MAGDVLGHRIYSARYSELKHQYVAQGRLQELVVYNRQGFAVGRVRNDYDDMGRRVRAMSPTRDPAPDRRDVCLRISSNESMQSVKQQTGGIHCETRWCWEMATIYLLVVDGTRIWRLFSRCASDREFEKRLVRTQAMLLSSDGKTAE